MIEKIKIENFKLFNKIEINNLKPINIVGGKNNVGKSSFLEAIFLFHDRINPDMFVKQLGWRGVQKITINEDTIWVPIFNDFDTSKTIKVKIGKEEMSIKLNKNYNPRMNAGSLNKDFSDASISKTTASMSSLEIIVEMNNEELQKSHLIIDEKGLSHHIEISISKPPILSYISNKTISSSDTAVGFSKLDEINQGNDVVESLQIIEPRLETLSLNVLGNQTMVFGKLHGVSKKFPVAYMGDGINKLLSIITRIAQSANGVVLIDEIENGFHYSIMDKVWKILSKTAEIFKCQLFITTHSYECLEAAHKGLEENSDSYCYLRFDRNKDKNIIAKQYSHAVLGAAIESGWEVR